MILLLLIIIAENLKRDLNFLWFYYIMYTYYTISGNILYI